MSSPETISDARDRLNHLQATAEKAIQSQNRHRIILVFLFSIAVICLILFLGMEIFFGQANPTKEGRGEHQPPQADVTSQSDSDATASSTETASGTQPRLSPSQRSSTLESPAASPSPRATPNYQTLKDAMQSPVGIVFQGIFLVSVISLLIVRRATLRAVDTADLQETEKKIEHLGHALDQCSQDLTKHMRESGLGEQTLEGFVHLVSRDKAAQKGLTPGIAASVERFRTVNDELAKIILQINSAAAETKGMFVSKERIVAGHALALIATLVSAIPIIIWISYQRAIDHETAYLALASISCACVAAAHALLGRRKTDEARFIEDLRNLSTTIDVVTKTLKPIQISAGEQKTV